MLWKQVRELNARYEDKQESLQKDYIDALKELQALCSHEKNTRWVYKTDTYGEPASTAMGALIKYRECEECGLLEAKIDDMNDYDSEIVF